MIDANSETARKIIDGFKCAALQPGLRNILLFNASSHILDSTAATFKKIIEELEQVKVEIVQLGSLASEDDIWGTLKFSKVDLELSISDIRATWQHGLIQATEKYQIIVLHDLAKLKIQVLQALMLLMDTPVARLERHGQSIQWAPNIIWIAGCRRQDIGQVSSHLLDRFVLRLDVRSDAIANRFDILCNLLNDGDEILNDNASVISANVIPQLIQSRKIKAEFTYSVADTVINLFAYDNIGIRREIGLGRISKAYAQMDGSRLVTLEHVRNAADLIGLRLPEFDENKQKGISNVSDSQPEQQEGKSDYVEYDSSPVDNLTEIEHDEEVLPGEEKFKKITTFQENIWQTPWLEDVLPIEHEYASLKYNVNPHSMSVERGAVIGVKKTTSLLDISMVGTILEAAKYYKIRRLLNPEMAKKHPVRPADLRAYRREVGPGEMLMLILDYTSMNKSVWEDELFPYLRWAYVRRASVCIIQIGAANSKNELRADSILTRNILDPRIGKALGGLVAGRATPLAHGIQLAYRTLQKTSQHGKNTILQIKVVLLTDGRGNIPLQASQTQAIEFPVGNRGIEDVWSNAKAFSNIKNLDITILKPDVSEYGWLPEKLASILRARIVNLRSL